MRRGILVILFIWVVIGGVFSETVYDAADAFDYVGKIETEHAGFTGNGYVNPDNAVGTHVIMKVSMAEMGEQTMTVYYANGSGNNRAMDIEVNGVKEVELLDFHPTGAWTSYGTQSTTIPLNAGINSIRFISTTTDGGPNIDKITLTGEAGPEFYQIEWNAFGNGTVTGLEPKVVVVEGEEVTLTAEAGAGAEFGGWRGSFSTTEKTLTFTPEKSKSLSAIFINEGTHVKTDKQVGWVTWQESGHREISGGEGGTEVTVSNQADLEYYLGRTEPYIVNIDGHIHLTPFGKKVEVRSNKTIRGVGTDALITNGGFRIRNQTNVIVQYLTMRDAFVDWEGKTTDNDAFDIQGSTYIWINHCDFSHYDDGLIDIKNGADFITISWNHFHNHNKVMMIGAGDNVAMDVGKLNVTIHHNWFNGAGGNGIGQRMPMGRYGKMHVFNNYYNDVLIRGPEANFEANFVVDNNYFLNCAMPHAIVGGAGDNRMNASGNIYVNSASRRDSDGRAFNPADYYNFTYNNAEDVPAIVMLGAGVNNITEIGEEPVTSVAEPSILKKKSLGQNFPNPSVGKTTIPFAIYEPATIQLELYDMFGRRLKVLANESYSSGDHQIVLDSGELKSGVYIYTLTNGKNRESKSMVVAH